MAKYKYLLIMVASMLLLSGCKQSTLEKAINKLPFKVNEVISTKKVDNITIVLYTTKAKGEEVNYIKKPVLGVAFFKGNDKIGWENVGPNGWEHYENENYTIYHQPYIEHTNQGKTVKDFDVIFGEINNKDIQRIEIANQDTKKFKQVKMIEHDKKRYYLGIGYHPEVRAINGKNEVINQ